MVEHSVSLHTEHKGLVERQTSALATGQQLLIGICVPSLAVATLFVSCHTASTIIWKLHHTILCALYRVGQDQPRGLVVRVAVFADTHLFS